jgi:hypothetical protein
MQVNCYAWKEESNQDVRRVAENLDVVKVAAPSGTTNHGLDTVEVSVPSKTKKEKRPVLEEPVM